MEGWGGLCDKIPLTFLAKNNWQKIIILPTKKTILIFLFKWIITQVYFRIYQVVSVSLDEQSYMKQLSEKKKKGYLGEGDG